MASYEFRSVLTGEPVIPAKIDDEVCEFYSDKASTTRFHPCYDFLLEVGFAILYASGTKECVDEESFNRYIGEKLLPKMQSIKEDINDPKWVKHISMLRRFLYETYSFRAWR